VIRSALLLACVAVLPAAELVVRDVRVAAGSRPVGFSYSLDSATQQSSGDDAFNAALGLEVGGRWSFARSGDSLGLVVGADFENDGYTYDGGGSLGVTALRGTTGLGWAATDRCTVTGELGASWGLSRLNLPEQLTAPAYTATGTVFGYDLRVGATWLMTRRFGIGGHAGWMVASHTLSGDSVDTTLDQSGWFIGLEAIWRFTDAPTPLE